MLVIISFFHVLAHFLKDIVAKRGYICLIPTHMLVDKKALVYHSLLFKILLGKFFVGNEEQHQSVLSPIKNTTLTHHLKPKGGNKGCCL